MLGLVLNRRQVLVGLSSFIPASPFMRPAFATAEDANDFLQVSRIITGSENISEVVAGRIEALLEKRYNNFSARLGSLVDNLNRKKGGRAERLRGLTDDDVDFALKVAKPWYLGYVGTPSDFVLEDDAEFATFLEAQSWQKILDKVPIPTLPRGAAGWWDSPPDGVTAPDMPDQITSWTFYPSGPEEILAPDSEWRDYATADHDTIDAARRAKPMPPEEPTNDND